MMRGPVEPSAAPWQVLPLHYLVDTVLSAGGSGKSTIANMLHDSVQASNVVHTGDIAWHHSFFDWSDLLIEGVLKPLWGGKQVHYQPPGWRTHGRPGAIEIPAGRDLVIVEGVGAGRTEVMPWLDCLLWVQSDLYEAERRGLARDGDTEEARNFWHEWMVQEFDFLGRERPWDRATVIANGTPTQVYDRNSQVVVSAQPCVRTAP